MVARPYLRTPRAVIIQTTTLARRKRHEFVRAVSKGLIPPETPPTLRKVRKRRFPGLMALDPVDDVSISIACPMNVHIHFVHFIVLRSHCVLFTGL